MRKHVHVQVVSHDSNGFLRTDPIQDSDDNLHHSLLLEYRPRMAFVENAIGKTPTICESWNESIARIELKFQCRFFNFAGVFIGPPLNHHGPKPFLESIIVPTFRDLVQEIGTDCVQYPPLRIFARIRRLWMISSTIQRETGIFRVSQPTLAPIVVGSRSGGVPEIVSLFPPFQFDLFVLVAFTAVMTLG